MLSNQNFDSESKDVYVFFEFENYQPIYLGNLEQKLRF